MALVIIGGLAASTLLTLFVVPSLFLRFGETREAEKTEVSMERLIDLTRYDIADSDGREEREEKELIGGGR
jgi:predicted RND superfamily exporter protein